MTVSKEKENRWITYSTRLVYGIIFIVCLKFLVGQMEYPEPMESDNADDYTVSAAINTDKSKDELCVFSKTKLSDEAIYREIKNQFKVVFPADENPIITRPCKEDVTYPATMIIR